MAWLAVGATAQADIATGPGVNVSSTAAPASPPATPDTTPPMIGGVLPGFAVVGQPFSFQPSASDTNGVALTFSISNEPAWASFDPATGRLSGTPGGGDLGPDNAITISVSDGTFTRSLPTSSINVVASPADNPRKSNYGHYFATHYSDTPADAAMLCEQPGVTGSRLAADVEPGRAGPRRLQFRLVRQGADGDRGLAQSALPALADGRVQELCQQPVKNPCPVYLQAQHSAMNSNGNGAVTCFMWEPRW